MKEQIMKKYNGRLTLRNDVHGTEATVIVRDGIISHASLARARRILCGMGDCACGDIRGTQDMIIDLCYDRDGEYATVAQK